MHHHPPLAIRYATEHDATVVARLDRAVLGSSERETLLHRAVAAGECVVAERGAALVGLATMDQSFYGRCFLSLLIVHREYRRRGVGSALIAYLERHCPGDDLFTSTNASNLPMRRLCERLRFVESGRIENLDPGDPEIVYYKRLHAPINPLPERE